MVFPQIVLVQLVIYTGEEKDLNSYTIQKSNSKWIIVLNIKAKTIKLLEGIARDVFVTVG